MATTPATIPDKKFFPKNKRMDECKEEREREGEKGRERRVWKRGRGRGGDKERMREGEVIKQMKAVHVRHKMVIMTDTRRMTIYFPKKTHFTTSPTYICTWWEGAIGFAFHLCLLQCLKCCKLHVTIQKPFEVRI